MNGISRYFIIIGGMKSNFTAAALMKTIAGIGLLMTAFAWTGCSEHEEKQQEKDIVKKSELFP